MRSYSSFYENALWQYENEMEDETFEVRPLTREERKIIENENLEYMLGFNTKEWYVVSNKLGAVYPTEITRSQAGEIDPDEFEAMYDDPMTGYWEFCDDLDEYLCDL